jgi:GNAT superfamily N-acetyltransferase
MKAVVRLRRRGWFLTEVKHLAVPESHRRKGIGSLALAEVLGKLDAACLRHHPGGQPGPRLGSPKAAPWSAWNALLFVKAVIP